MICLRLDRCYLNQNLTQVGGLIAIWPILAHVLDHVPIFVKIQFKRTQAKQNTKLNQFLLSIEEKPLLLAKWQPTMTIHSSQIWNEKFVEGIKAVKIYNIGRTVAHKAENREKYLAQFNPIFEVEMELQMDWNNQTA
uniref:Uncharacterized protein n=1 Tax=Physcomitrium patens TaxID=3218 RepID=A0A2K1IIZ1_PHYPA|nr:hypothetical protein PHYPA_027934 [Physcomitrium patens]